MNIVQFDGMRIRGFGDRLQSTAVGASPKTDAVEKLWSSFHETFYEKMSKRPQGSTTYYAVYSDYAPGAENKFSVLIGSDILEKSDDVKEVAIEAGSYAVFVTKGEMPKCVDDTWNEIHEYFSKKDTPHKRKYGTDFEMYRTMGEGEIYVSIA